MIRLWGWRAALLALVLSAIGGAARAETVSLELEETNIIGETEPGVVSVTDGKIEVRMPEGTATYTWTPPPKSIGPGGVDFTFTANAESAGGEVYASIGVYSSTFKFEPDPPGFGFWVSKSTPTDSQTHSYHGTPMEGLTVGSTVGLSVGIAQNANVVYIYRVKAGGRPEVLTVTEDCPDTIEISALPSMVCHLIIDGFRRNTADPVEVILPGVTDGFGNHANGIQVLTAGAADPANWDYPRFWDMIVFACPGQDNAGANCYGNVTTPGPVTVTIIVRQKGSPDAIVPLTFNAVPHQ